MTRIVYALLFGLVAAVGALGWSAAAAQARPARGQAALENCLPASAALQGLVQNCAAAATAAASSAGAAAAASAADAHARQLAADGALRRDLTLAAARVAAGLGGVALLLSLVAVVQARTHGLRFSSYWGGFGGTGTGWQLTPAAVSLVAAALVALAALAALTLGMGVMYGSASPGAAAPAAPAAASAAAKT